MKTLYVHVGTPKTATSAIQKFCCDNRSVLEAKGYCYPEFPWTYPPKSANRNALFLQSAVRDASGRRNPEEEKRRVREGLDMVVRQFAEHSCVVLSDEGLWQPMYDRRKTLWQELVEEAKKSGFTVKAIVYLRRQDEFLSSWWNQLIKMRRPVPGRHYETMTWEEYRGNVPDSMQLDYYGALERISAVIGKENVIVRRFDKKYFYGGTIQADFLHCLGLEMTEEFRILQENVNMRLSGNMPEIKRILNTMPEMNARENWFFWQALLSCSDISEKEYKCSMFSPEETAEFLEIYEEGNQKIVQEYLLEGDAPLFHTDIKDVPKWEKDNPYMQADVIRFIGETDLLLFRKIEEENAKLRRELNELKDMLKHPGRAVFRKIKKGYVFLIHRFLLI